MARKAGQEEAAVLYIRVSTMDQAEHGVSLDAQEQRLRSYAAAQGLSVVAVLREEAISGTVPLSERPEGRELVGLVTSGNAAHVVALKLDRLFRSAVDALQTTAEWDRRGVSLHLVDMGGQSLNTGSAMGRMMLTMLAGFAQFERDLTAERTKAALAHKRDAGTAYSPTPYGKVREGETLRDDATEQSILARIRAMRAKGLALRRIADRLNGEGIASKQGRTWYASTVAYMLRRTAAEVSR
jgi:DNA invertase Pin-like site-specific DNA recombinase